MTTTETPTEAVETVKASDPDIARKIWLAGVGAYGRIFTETRGAVEKLASGASEAFDELVAKGEEVEDAVRTSFVKSQPGEKIVAMVETATSSVHAFRAEQKAALETRIGKVRETVAETLAPLNVVALGQAIEKLSTHVEALTSEVAALKAEKAATAAVPAQVAPVVEAPAKPSRAKASETVEA
jgi:poly(hydroxyalkanoate) granule-associated protein